MERVVNKGRRRRCGYLFFADERKVGDDLIPKRRARRRFRPRPVRANPCDRGLVSTIRLRHLRDVKTEVQVGKPSLAAHKRCSEIKSRRKQARQK
jgi:hypothetical protein